jgi:hypothetical protein
MGLELKFLLGSGLVERGLELEFAILWGQPQVQFANRPRKRAKDFA